MGEQAVEILQLVATCMAADMGVEQLAEMELAYPTFTAIVGLAARPLSNQSAVVYNFF
jgi:pyruvate/2-oxoglutarate dehydrogenase complex dihydrolipoamide dehydrogenase (E3) component